MLIESLFVCYSWHINRVSIGISPLSEWSVMVSIHYHCSPCPVFLLVRWSLNGPLHWVTLQRRVNIGFVSLNTDELALDPGRRKWRIWPIPYINISTDMGRVWSGTLIEALKPLKLFDIRQKAIWFGGIYLSCPFGS